MGGELFAGLCAQFDSTTLGMTSDYNRVTGGLPLWVSTKAAFSGPCLGDIPQLAIDVPHYLVSVRLAPSLFGLCDNGTGAVVAGDVSSFVCQQYLAVKHIMLHQDLLHRFQAGMRYNRKLWIA